MSANNKNPRLGGSRGAFQRGALSEGTGGRRHVVYLDSSASPTLQLKKGNSLLNFDLIASFLRQQWDERQSCK